MKRIHAFLKSFVLEKKILPRANMRGFTLIEVLVVIAIIAILAAIVVIAINPALHFAQARNVEREAHVDTILNAIGQNMVANRGILTGCGAIPTTAIALGTSGATDTPPTSVDLSSCLAPYLTSGMPMDPNGGTNTDTKYTILETATLRFTVCSPNHVEAAIAGSSPYCITR